MERPLIIRDAVESDFPEIQKIYARYVEATTVSLEEIVPDVVELLKRWKTSFEFLVAEIDGKIAGYAYAFTYRPRSAYRFTVEESVYISKDYQGLGLGRKLLEELIKRCREKGLRQMLAVIAGADNAASIEFHKKLGFRQSGVLEKFGFKFGGWVDTVLMQKEL